MLSEGRVLQAMGPVSRRGKGTPDIDTPKGVSHIQARGLGFPPCSKVGILYGLLARAGNRQASIYADSWGIKRLISLAIRRWKAPIRGFRDHLAA